MKAMIYQPAKNAMQSGKSRPAWILEYSEEKPQPIDPLMGWTGSEETASQIILPFPTKETAIAYAREHGIIYDVIEPKKTVRQPKAYADNFRFDRIHTGST